MNYLSLRVWLFWLHLFVKWEVLVVLALPESTKLPIFVGKYSDLSKFNI